MISNLFFAAQRAPVDEDDDDMKELAAWAS